jgi:hypothetical protein
MFSNSTVVGMVRRIITMKRLSFRAGPYAKDDGVV